MSRHPHRRPLALATLALALAASVAHAAETTATAPDAQADPSADTMAQIQQWIAQAKPVDLDEPGADGVVVREAPRKVHGEAGVAVGTGGYRSAYVASLFPIGESGTLGIAVSETRMGSTGRFAGPGYGHGDSTRQSVAMSLALGEAATGESACRPAAYGYGYGDPGFGPPRGEFWGDPGAQALARTSCREALKTAESWRD